MGIWRKPETQNTILAKSHQEKWVTTVQGTGLLHHQNDTPERKLCESSPALIVF